MKRGYYYGGNPNSNSQALYPPPSISKCWGSYKYARERVTSAQMSVRAAMGHAKGKQKKSITLATKPFDHRGAE